MWHTKRMERHINTTLLISKEAYKKRFMSTAIENYFNSSYKNVVSFFAKEEKISVKELKEIIALIEKNPKLNKPWNISLKLQLFCAYFMFVTNGF